MIEDHHVDRRYGLLVSTTSCAARNAYVEACEEKLTMHPGAIETFDRAIAADPGFALAHAARAHARLERGDAAAARAAMASAKSLTAGLSAREESHVAFFGLLVMGDAEAALSAVHTHLDAWPRDIVVLATTAFTNGLIGSSGRAGQKRRSVRANPVSPGFTASTPTRPSPLTMCCARIFSASVMGRGFVSIAGKLTFPCMRAMLN